MKLRNIILSLIAIVACTVSCEQEIKHYLDNIQVSSSYAAISTSGSSCNITINATDSWTVEALDKKTAEWLTVSPMSGSAGESTITISAGATLDGRTAELKINCGGQTQLINVIQGLSTISPATCAEIIAGPDSKTFEVTGICTAIANTNYGNWYINDGTGEVYIYGTVNSKGAYDWASFNIEVGDEVTVRGPKTTYNGTVELVDAEFIKVNKSLIKVDAIIFGQDTTTVMPLEGGIMQVDLVNKGKGVYTSIPEDAKSWLSISAVADNKIYFNVARNEGGDRQTTLEFKTTDGKKEYKCETTISQKGAIIDVTIAEFNAAEVGTTIYRIQGVVTKIANSAYGNFYIADATGDTYVYGIGKKGFFETTGVKVGDIVTVLGTRGQYKTTIEMMNGQFEDIIHVSEISIPDFLAKADDKNAWYMVSGTVTEIANSTYGNLYIADENGNKLYVYGCYPGWNATGDLKKQFSKLGVEVGDKLTMIGYKTSYKGSPQMGGGVFFSNVKAN